MKSYHETLATNDQERQGYERKASNQDELILNYFRMHKRASPSQVWEAMPQSPLTSIRRGITNLTNEGLLIKTEHQVKGMYGRPECVWERPGNAMQRELF